MDFNHTHFRFHFRRNILSHLIFHPIITIHPALAENNIDNFLILP